MKKLSVLIVLIILLTLVSCKQDKPLEDVFLSSKQTVYSSDVEKITITWNNNSDEIIKFGRLFTLDKKVKNEWVEFEPTREDYAFEYDLLGVNPSGTTQLDYYMFMYAPLEKGEYRIVTNWYVGDYESSKQNPIYFEFEIE